MSRYPRGRKLMLVTDPEMTRWIGLVAVVRAAVAGGVDMVQLRDKHADDAALVRTASLLMDALRPLGVPLIVNDRPAVAARVGADGVHIGQDDGDAKAVRAVVGDGAILGWSVTDLSQLAHVPPEVDYIGFGPIFATGTKPDAAPALGLDGLRAARSLTHLPLIAIGGIDSSNAGDVVAAGADGIAVVSAICAAPDPEGAARELARIVREVAR